MILPRTPAFSDTRAAPDWCRADSLSSDYISNRIGLSGKIEKIVTTHPSPAGYFRLLEHNPPLFLKIIPMSGSDNQKKSKRMLEWLAQHKVSVGIYLSKFQTAPDDEYDIFIYEYIPGHFAKPCQSYMTSLGSEIRKLHFALTCCPWRREIRKASEDRLFVLDMYLKQVRTLRSYVSIPESVFEILKICPSNILLWLKKDKRQVVHGDINYGNVIFSDCNTKPVFLDFESCWISWFSPAIELSFVLQRFILNCGSDLDLHRIAQALLHGYTNSEFGIYEDHYQLEMTLKALSVRTLLLLIIKNENDPSSVSTSEWEKFVKLYYSAEHQSDLLREIAEYSINPI